MLRVLDLQKLVRYPKTRVRRDSPKSICTERDFYETEGLNSFGFPMPEMETNEIENNVLKPIEDIYPSMVDKLLSDQGLEKDTVAYFGDFLVQMKIRNPFHLRYFVETYGKENFERHMLEIEEDAQIEFTAISVEIKRKLISELLRQSEFDNHLAKKQSLLSLAGRFYDRKYSQIVVDLLWKQHWQIWETDDDAKNHFVTTDNPGFSQASDQSIHNLGFGGRSVTFPLSPEKCLVIINRPTGKITNGLIQPDHAIVSEKVIEGVNLLSRRMVNKLIIGRYANDLELIRDRFV